ncbi:hypothetical protein PTKIN_Ptkin06aG0214700 [Pterospermum kingtungense]
MAEKIQAKPGVFVPPNKQLSSYVISITFPQPVIRIRIPNVLVKALKRRNQSSTIGENGEKGSKNKTKHKATSKKGLRNKVGSAVSTLFGKNNKKSAETDSKGGNGGVDDEEMKKLKEMVERVDMGPEKITEKTTGEDGLKDGVQPVMAIAATDQRKERPKSCRTYPKKNALNNEKTRNVQDGATVVNNVDSSVVARVGDKGPKTVVKQAENSNDLTRFRPKSTVSSNGKPKNAWSVKRMSSALVRGKSEKHELCKKRILMGVKCRPLNHSGRIQYDQNGVLVPDIVP